MARLNTILLFMLIGAAIGTVAASLIVPPFLTWYNEPGRINQGNQVQVLCNIPELIRYTSSHLLRWQLVGAVAGAVLFLFPGILVSRRRQPSLALETTAVEPGHGG